MKFIAQYKDWQTWQLSEDVFEVTDNTGLDKHCYSGEQEAVSNMVLLADYEPIFVKSPDKAQKVHDYQVTLNNRIYWIRDAVSEGDAIEKARVKEETFQASKFDQALLLQLDRVIEARDSAS